MRERLRQIINRITARSVTVHRRGQKLFQESRAPFWERYADHGGIRFAINEQHPLIASLGTRLSTEDADLLRVLLDSIAASCRWEMIYSDYSTHPREINQRAVDESQTLERLKSLRKVLYGDGRAIRMPFSRSCARRTFSMARSNWPKNSSARPLHEPHSHHGRTEHRQRAHLGPCQLGRDADA